MFHRAPSRPALSDEPGQAVTLYLVRHAEPQPADRDLVEDPPLTARGRRQAQQLARRLEHERFHHVYVSDLTRAYRTAEPTLRHHARAAVTVTPLLREVSHLLYFDTVVAGTPDETALVEKEKLNVTGFVKHVCALHRPGDRLLVFAHGNFIRSFLPRLAGIDPDPRLILEINHASITIVERYLSGRVVLRASNCVCHLRRGDVS